MKLRVRLQLWLLVAACASFGACKKSGPVYELNSESSAMPYVSEFLAGDYRQDENTAPDGRGEVVLQTHGPIVWLAACHSLWLEGRGKRRRIISLREADPGSGLSFSWRWSSDSNAIFISGQHSGFGCENDELFQSFSLIYTANDDKLWEVPEEAALRPNVR